MPKVNTQKAGKDYPELDIKKGDTYYSWSHFRGPVMKSKTYPKPSQLTQSHWSDVYAAREAIEAAGFEDAQNLADELNAAADAVRDVAGRYEEAEEAMGGHGGANQAKADQLEEMAGQLEDIAGRVEDLTAGDGSTEGPNEELEGEVEEDLESLFQEAMDLDWEPQE